MKHPYVLAALLVFAGCPMPFSRPVPSETEYIQRFLTHVQPEQIEDLQFSYHGAVGGEYSIARFRVDNDAIHQLRANAQREEIFFLEDGDSEKDLKERIAVCARESQIPGWFDFPFDKTMAVFIDSGDHTDGHPAYKHEWYVDEARGIVYFVMIRA